jgi:membrane protein implicated in regulation of membrane protease activity
MCGHTYSTAIQAVFWPTVAVLLFALLSFVVAWHEERHARRVANERNRRLQIQLNAWKSEPN